MKYLKIFNKTSDYEVFKGGDDYITPNISYVEETEGLVFEPAVIENDSGLDFPIYLVEGDNGQLGINLWQYLKTTYQLETEMFPIELSSGECIVIQGGSLESKVGVNMNTVHYDGNCTDDNGYEGDAIKLKYSYFEDCYLLFSDGHLGPYDA